MVTDQHFTLFGKVRRVDDFDDVCVGSDAGLCMRVLLGWDFFWGAGRGLWDVRLVDLDGLIDGLKVCCAIYTGGVSV